MKISASVYSSKNKNVLQLISELNALSIDAFHIDCNDDENVFKDIQLIHQNSEKIIDLHIISPNASRFNDLIQANKIDWVSYQFEELNVDFSLPTFQNTQVGLAVLTETPIKAYAHLVPQLDFLLLMTTTPGKSGGQFSKESFRKLRSLKQEFPYLRLHVDGGINEEVSFILRDLGIFAAVSGSFLLNDEPSSALLKLKLPQASNHFVISDFMIERAHLPIVREQDASFEKILQTTDHFGFGFCLLEDEQQHLKGISSHADLRKGLLKNLYQLNKITYHDIVNPKPKTVLQTQSVQEMISFINQLPFTVLFLPVIDENNCLVGAITFNQLIKGES